MHLKHGLMRDTGQKKKSALAHESVRKWTRATCYVSVCFRRAVATRGLRMPSVPASSDFNASLPQFPSLSIADGRCTIGSGRTGLIYELPTAANTPDVIVVRNFAVQRAFDSTADKGFPPAWLSHKNLAAVKVQTRENASGRVCAVAWYSFFSVSMPSQVSFPSSILLTPQTTLSFLAHYAGLNAGLRQDLTSRFFNFTLHFNDGHEITLQAMTADE
jgi:hypothetical protein